MKAEDLHTVDDVLRLEFPFNGSGGGHLAVFEATALPGGRIERVFTVAAASAPVVRGRHAHYRCAQLMICVHGAVELRCDDGKNSLLEQLDRPNAGLFVPPTIWSEQTYLVPGSVLMVICDRPYEADDYIRDWSAFEAFRRNPSVG